MNCARCGALLPPGAMFCRDCGAIVPEIPPRGQRGGHDPVGEREVPDERQADEMMMRRRRIFLYGFGAIFLVLMVSRATSLAWLPWTAWMGGGQGWGGPGQNWSGYGQDWAGGTPVVTNANELFETYSANRNAARARFGRRPLVVTGTFVRIDGVPPLGPDLMLATSDPDKLLRADLVARSTGEAALLKPGDQVTVGCRHVEESLGPDPWLRSCEIEAKPALPALPAPPPLPTLTAPEPEKAPSDS